MIKRLFVTGIACVLMSATYAQEDSTKKDKLLDHYVGLQVNELIQQALNLSNSQVLEHPYLINYTINHHNTGWGINFGFGYSFSNTREGDAINQITTEITEASFRIGPEKKFYMGKRLIAGVGFDYINNQSLNDSKTFIDQGQDNFTETRVEESFRSEGLGPRLSISFRVNNWFLIGTEASYYYTLDKTKQRVTETSSFNSSETFQQFDDEFEERNMTFYTPTSIFLILNF